MNARRIKQPSPELLAFAFQLRRLHRLGAFTGKTLATLLSVSEREVRLLEAAEVTPGSAVRLQIEDACVSLEPNHRDPLLDALHDLEEAESRARREEAERRWKATKAKAAVYEPETASEADIAHLRERYTEAQRLPPELARLALRGELTFGGQDPLPGLPLSQDEEYHVREWNRPAPQPAGIWFRDWVARNRA